MKINTAYILAAGKGNRIDVFETPKPLLKVGGTSLIMRTLNALKNAGITEINVVIQKGNTVIQKELIGYPAKIHFIEVEIGKRGILDSIMMLKNYLKKPSIITVCDLISKKNPYKSLVNGLKGSETFSILVSANKLHNANSGANMRVRCDRDIVKEMHENIKNWNALDKGVYFVTPKIVSDLSEIDSIIRKSKTFPDLVTEYSKKHVVRAVYFDAPWFDINIPKTYMSAELFLAGNNRKISSGTDVVIAQKRALATAKLRNEKKTVTDIIVKRNILEHVEEYEIIPPASYHSPHHLLIDENIDKEFGDKVFKRFRSLGYSIYKYVIPPGETAKSINGYVELSGKIISNGLDKKSFILSLGGGATKDMTGFLAATLYRGIGFISMPTTVLSQVDAAIALKQGVNGTDGKNLLGAYYAPEKIIVDPAVLISLPDRFIYDGLAECIKQAFAYDITFYKMLAGHSGPIKDIDFLEAVVKKAIILKTRSIEKDIHEDNIALVNQYGHEFGHAVEHLSGYKFGHGESVAIGMRVSAELSHILGITTRAVVDAHIALLKKYNLPYKVPQNISPEDILLSLRFNKKYYSGEPRFVLVKKIGTVWRDHGYYTVNCRDEFIREAVLNSYD